MLFCLLHFAGTDCKSAILFRKFILIRAIGFLLIVCCSLEWLRIRETSQSWDIVYFEVETLDQTLEKDEVFGTVEAVKTVSDLFLPLSGEIIEFNEALESKPESVNSDPYGEEWMIKVKISNTDEIESLLSSESYKELIGA